MGQYYIIVNVDKKEMLVPWSFSEGAKLMEWSYNNKPIVLAFLNLIADRWKNDRVYVVGDYADIDDPSEPYYKTLFHIYNELNTTNLYKYAENYYVDISADVDTTDRNYHYVYNHELKLFIDLNKGDDIDIFSKQNKKIAPLPILLTMGNGRGGGDYYSRKGNGSEKFVGSWCGSSNFLEVTKEKLPLEYDELIPDF